MQQLRLLDDNKQDAKAATAKGSGNSSQWTTSIIKKASGHGWRMVNWKDPFAGEEHLRLAFSCDWVSFVSTTGASAEMCVYRHRDLITGDIRMVGRWTDCDALPVIWFTDEEDDRASVYVDIGANIGACVLEVLLTTNANVIAFEPHPMNLYNLKQTVSRLPPELRNRLALFPIGLGDATTTARIYSAKHNMGNSVLGKIIKDDPQQEFDPAYEFDVPVERLDSILSEQSDAKVKLIKMDAQGYECSILEGMGSNLAAAIRSIKFEYGIAHLEGQDCHDLLQRFRGYGFAIYTQLPSEQRTLQLQRIDAAEDEGIRKAASGTTDLYASRTATLERLVKDATAMSVAREMQLDQREQNGRKVQNLVDHIFKAQ